MQPMKRSEKARNARSDRRGAAAVEMALVLPLFFLIIFGILEFGRAFMIEHLLTNAARYGVRMAVVDGSTNSEVEQAVKTFCASAMGVDEADVDVTISVIDQSGDGEGDDEESSVVTLSSASTRDTCTVTVTVSFEDVSLASGTYMRDAELSSTCTMEHE